MTNLEALAKKSRADNERIHTLMDGIEEFIREINVNEDQEYPTITVRIGASAFSNISYRTEWEFEIEADELEGMDRNQIWAHVVDEYGMNKLMEDIELFVTNMDEVVKIVEGLDKE